jgi:carbonic anhydrase
MRHLPELFRNNVAWAAARAEEDPEFFTRLSDVQAPAHLWIGCSDSRVPANEIVGLDSGELFVHRNIANVVDASDENCHAVVQYAVDVLKVEHIIVCGHYGCGGVLAALGPAVEAPLDGWLDRIRGVAGRHASSLAEIEDEVGTWRRLCELNVAAQVDGLAGFQVVQSAWDRGQNLVLHGWIYELQDGLLRDLGVRRANAEG